MKGLNYKSSNFREDLKEATPHGVDLYFDGVGGDILDQTLLHMNLHGKIIACGSSKSYLLHLIEIKRPTPIRSDIQFL